MQDECLAQTLVEPPSLQSDIWASVISTFYAFSEHVPTRSSLQPPGGGEYSLFTKKDLSPGFCVSLHRVLRQGQNWILIFISWSAYHIRKPFPKSC